jgi:plastocyanin
MTFKRSFIAAIFVLALLAGCGKSDKKSSSTTKAADTNSTTTTASSGASTGNAVTIKGFAFNPNALKVSTGTKVTWTNKDSTDHTTTADKGDPATFDSGHLGNGKSFSFTFAKPGTYKYFCNIHNYMKGTVEVS